MNLFSLMNRFVRLFVKIVSFMVVQYVCIVDEAESAPGNK